MEMLKKQTKNQTNPKPSENRRACFRPPIMFLFLDLKISWETIKSVAENYTRKVYDIIQLVNDEKWT